MTAQRIYIASRFTSRERLSTIRDVLEFKGFKVTSRWLNASDHRPEPGSPEWKRFCVINSTQDVEDALAADTVILDILDGHGTRSGEWVEFGIGLGLKKLCIVVGDTDNVFVYHPHVVRLNSWNEVYAMLKDEANKWP